MARLDSGNETLLSDDSSCDMVTPSTPVSSGHNAANHSHSQSDDSIVPPKITPFSGVLGKGKIVVRPIAFKPVSTARFSNVGERYGSTPILARPGSQLTLYGSSTDLRHQHHHHSNSFNYSLDRKSMSSASSPPLGIMSSLPATRLHGYESLDCVSPPSRSNGHCSLSIKSKSSSFRMISNAESSSSLLDLTPSPSDSGVAELEAALRERDSELVYLRQTMEHNEQAIIRVYQEKERAWDRDKRRLKAVHENRLRASAQKVLKLEQMLMMQTYQLQQEKKRLREEADRAARETSELRQEVDLLRARLEETEWGLCQKTGELGLLKAQLKDSQGEQTTKGHELIQLRNQLRDTKMELDRKNVEIGTLAKDSEKKDRVIDEWKNETERLSNERKENDKRREEEIAEVEELKEEVTTLRKEIVDVCQVLKEEQDEKAKLSEAIDIAKRGQFNKRWAGEWTGEQLLTGTGDEGKTDDAKHLKQELEKLSNQMLSDRTEFEQERITWAQEKEKVLRYQRQLQLNYVQMFRRTRSLEAEFESLTIELELETKAKGFRLPKKNVPTPSATASLDL